MEREKVDITSAVLVLLAIGLTIVMLLTWWEPRHAGASRDVGNIHLPTHQLANVASLITATGSATDGNYDSFDYPLGSSFVTISPFDVGRIVVTPDSAAAIVVQLGYGDNHIEDSASPPVNGVVVVQLTVPAGSELVDVPIDAVIPRGKYPFANVTSVAGPATWPGRLMVFGVERR